MKIGIDVGGTKTEGILLDPNGTEIDRKRINTEKSYDGTIKGILSIINHFEDKHGKAESVGMGMPGAISNDTALIKNANSIWLNGKPFKQDLDKILNRNIKLRAIDLLNGQSINKQFKELGVVQFTEIGDVVDPELHDALMMRTEEGKEENTVLEVFEKGYRYKDRVIRHAKVVVNQTAS